MEYIIAIVVLLALGAAGMRWLPCAYKKWMVLYWVFFVGMLCWVVLVPYRLARVVDALRPLFNW